MLLKKARPILINVLLFLVVSAPVYVLAEYAFPRVFTSLFPLAWAQKFEEFDGVWPLFQSSKRGFYPQDYIALSGDSYAMGMGDAMYENLPDARRPRFHSAHTIQDLTDRDVIAFGLPGSGSIRGAISNPVAGLHYLRKLVDENFPAPQWMVLYFYEGNDLTENWMYYEKTFLPDHAASDYENPAVFDNYVQQVVLGRQHLYLAADAAGWKDRLFFFRFAYRVFAEQVLREKFYRKKYPNEFGMIYVPESRWMPRRSDNPVNHAMIAGQSVPLPDNLQGPSMDLSPDQLQHAVGTFGKALAWSRHYFPQTRFAVVYIPSVLSTYHLVGNDVDAQNYFSDNTRFGVAALEQRHAWIQNEVARVCHEQDVPFVDTTDDLRQAAETQTLHGPKDWNHFGRYGYQVLGESVVRQLPALR
ncbi:MAG TPA: hypothetical protein VLB90_06100 [Pseudomonadales bacterium]|nr:hypothetical protein [Pseudomonadales bacterium]